MAASISIPPAIGAGCNTYNVKCLCVHQLERIDFEGDKSLVQQALSLVAYSQPDTAPEEFAALGAVVAEHGVTFGEQGWFGRSNLYGMFVIKGKRQLLVLVVDNMMSEFHQSVLQPKNAVELTCVVVEAPDTFELLQFRSDVEVMKLGMLVSRKLQLVSGRAGATPGDETTTDTAAAPAPRAADGANTVAVDGATVVLRRRKPRGERSQSMRQSFYKMFSRKKGSGSDDDGHGSASAGSVGSLSASPSPSPPPPAAAPAAPAVQETSIDASLAERRKSIKARVPARIAKCMKQLRCTPPDVEVPADQVTRIIKYIKIDTTEKEKARLPQLMREAAVDESRKVREKAKTQIQSIRSSKRGKGKSGAHGSDDSEGGGAAAAAAAAAATPKIRGASVADAGGYLTLESANEWLGEGAVDDGVELSDGDIASAMEQIKRGGTITGMEMRAVVSKARAELLQAIGKEHAEVLQRTRRHAHVKTKQMLVQKMGEMRKQNQRRTMMLSALDDTLGPDDTWAVSSPAKPAKATPPPLPTTAATASADVPGRATAVPLQMPEVGPPSPVSPPPDFSEPTSVTVTPEPNRRAISAVSGADLAADTQDTIAADGEPAALVPSPVPQPRVGAPESAMPQPPAEFGGGSPADDGAPLRDSQPESAMPQPPAEYGGGSAADDVAPLQVSQPESVMPRPPAEFSGGSAVGDTAERAESHSESEMPPPPAGFDGALQPTARADFEPPAPVVPQSDGDAAVPAPLVTPSPLFISAPVEETEDDAAADDQGLPEPSPLVIESPLPGGGPKFFPANDVSGGADAAKGSIVVVDGQEVQMRPRKDQAGSRPGSQRHSDHRMSNV